MKQIIVTGSRAYPEERRIVVDRALTKIWDRHGGFQLNVGDCPTGVDLYAKEWAEEVMQIKPRIFEADWDTLKKAAGPTRNARMVAEVGSGYCLGFPLPEGESRGTRNCMMHAFKNGHFWVYELPMDGGPAKLIAQPRF